MGQTWVTLQCIVASAGVCTRAFDPIGSVPNSPQWSPPATCLYARFCLKYIFLSVVSLHCMHYYPGNHCLTHNNSLAPLSINKGSRTALNHGRIQQQCSDRQCPETHFYSDPLETDIASTVITSINNSPSLAKTLFSPSPCQHSFRSYTQLDLSRMIHGSSPLRSLRDQPPLHSHPTNSVTQLPMPVASSQLPAATQRPQGGI